MQLRDYIVCHWAGISASGHAQFVLCHPRTSERCFGICSQYEASINMSENFSAARGRKFFCPLSGMFSLFRDVLRTSIQNSAQKCITFVGRAVRGIGTTSPAKLDVYGVRIRRDRYRRGEWISVRRRLTSSP